VRDTRALELLCVLAQVIQNPINGVLVFDAAVRRSEDNPGSTSAMAEGLFVDIENAFQALGPGHGGMTLCWRPYFRMCTRLQFLATPSRSDLTTPAVVRAGPRRPGRRGSE
jgi:hypothetical protein